MLVTDHTISVPCSHSPTRTRPHARPRMHVHKQACARAHACACTHKHTGSVTVIRCPDTQMSRSLSCAHARDAAATSCALAGAARSTQHAFEEPMGPLPRLGVPLTARTVPRVSTRDRRGLCHSTAVHRADLVLSTASTRHYAVIAGMRRRRMSSRQYYPPAPLVVAATASGAGLTDIPESVTVRSLVRPWRGFGVGLGRKARYGTVHRCQHAVVSCMEEVAFLLHVRCTEHVACYMMHAACCMLHDASGAQGEWLDLVCGGNQPHRVSMWLLVDCRRV
jgi:hypothetical protein